MNNLIESLKKSIFVLIAWRLLGSKIPPPHIVKQRAIRKTRKKFNARIFIESGTYLGDMVYAMRKDFQTIYSIELSDYYYKKALNRFKKNKNIKLIKGDSGMEIRKILKKVKEPVIFWLDGHYSGGKTNKGKFNTPIVRELNSIVDHKIKNHVILIDDAREFIGQNDYPTINSLKKIIKKRISNYTLDVEDDIIRISPKN